MGEHPAARRFEALDLAWATDVAKALRHIASRYAVPRLGEVWVTSEPALCIRYALGGDLLAVRFGHLDVDPVSGEAPRDSVRLASDLFHNLHTDPGPDAWRDADGHAWWGDPPGAGWDSVLAEGRRGVLPDPAAADDRR